MKSVVVALVAFGTLLVVLGANLVGADFGDQVTSDGNTFATDDLAVPVLTATGSGTGASGSVLLNWTNPNFADKWDVFRDTAPCASATFAGAPLVANLAVLTYTNTPVAAGTYCYKVRAKYQSWSEDSNLQEVTIDKASPTLSTTPNPSSATVGDAGLLKDSGTLSGGSSATGSITFRLFPPTDLLCAGTPSFTEAVTVSGNGTYNTVSGGTNNAAGTWHWTASYTGDDNNEPASSACGEPVTIGKASPTLVTTPSPSSGTVGVTVLNDSGALAGGYNPTGSITFKLFRPIDSTCSLATPFSETVTVTGNGPYSTSFVSPNDAAGTWHWTASYTGDDNNATASSGCSSEPVAIAKVTPTLSTTPSPASGTVGTTVLNDSGALGAGYNPTGTITFKLFPPTDATCAGTAAHTNTVTVSGNGTYNTSAGFTNNAAGTWHWTASYSGDTNNNPKSSACSDEPVTIAKVTPTLYTIPNTSTGTVGDVLKDSGLLGAGYNPTGNIVFKLFSPSDPDCTGTASFSETVTVSGTGTYSTVGGGTTNAAGTWHWTADYSGDTNNNTAASACGEAVSISAASATLLIKDSTTLSNSAVSGDVTLGPSASTIFASSPAASASGSVKTASNASNWLVNLVLKAGTPNANNATVDVAIWWQSSSCGSTPVAGQIFASSTSLSVNKPGSTDNVGRQLMVQAVSGPVVTHTFATNEVLCMQITVHTNSQDYITIHLDVTATSGDSGGGYQSGVVGPFALKP